jgi:hypothetical protein
MNGRAWPHLVESRGAVAPRLGLWCWRKLWLRRRRDQSAQVRALQAAVKAAPKSLAWRVRSRVGERVRWYETPEEVRH